MKTPRLVTTQILVTTTKMGNIFRRCSGKRSLNTEVDYLSLEENLQNQRLSQLDTRTSRTSESLSNTVESVEKIQTDTSKLFKNQEIITNDQVMMINCQKVLESRIRYQENSLNKLSISIQEMGNHFNRTVLGEKSTTSGKIIFKVDEHVFIWNNKTLQEYIREEVARQLANQSDGEDKLPDLI